MALADGHIYGQISIHALREEGDVLPDGWEVDDPYFYPRPPRGGRPAQLKKRQTVREFLSTPSARRATSCPLEGIATAAAFLSTPSARRATQAIQDRIVQIEFLSTPSARRATTGKLYTFLAYEISIHALREEGDRCNSGDWNSGD